MKKSPPRVFISYSHDSAEHKEWVLEFAATLRNRGVDAVLDQWDLKPGQDLPSFMEENLTNSDYAIMVCTKRYVEKANRGEGGVGYEKMIMTSQSLKKISESKVIPIIREKGEPLVPTFMSTRVYIDFSDDSENEVFLDELLRTLLNAPLYEKPEIGKNPFKSLELSRPDRTSDGVKEIMTDITRCFDRSTNEYIFFHDLVEQSKMRRLTIDKFLKICVDRKLVYIESLMGDIDCIYITEQGIRYLNENRIVEA